MSDLPAPSAGQLRERYRPGACALEDVPKTTHSRILTRR